MQCKQCNKPLEASRGTKPRQFCSDACRKLYKRTLDNKRTEQTDISTNGQEQTDKGSLGPVEPRLSLRSEHGEPNSEQKAEIGADAKTEVLSSPYPGGPDCECMMCQNYRKAGKSTERLNHGPAMTAEELAKISRLARNRVALPGDADYEVVAV